MEPAWTALRLLPENGLDRSLHAPVFIGLILLSFFRESLGWSFAGLVVPGYIATVLVAAPVTGALIVAESTLAYLLALALGRQLPRVGAWFTFFGRERFLLLIAASSLVRLSVEATLLPWLVARWSLAHSRELYSLGLVLVPLLSNSYWNAGFVRAFPRIGLVTAITYGIVSELLLPYTNFTLSRFQVANESVSLAFLESPHAHIILLVGAIVAARFNVRYGWDYNGILVPALLAVAWYQPSKVATTLMEAIVVLLLSRALSRVPPLSRVSIVGSRRVLVAFSVGFFVKYCAGWALFRWLPSVQLLDFLGFGYLLPSLLATKMWDRNSIPQVVMPTVQVSLLSFPVGTAIGFLMRTVDARPAAAVAAPPLGLAESVPLALSLGDSAPAPQRTGSAGRFVDAYQAALELATTSAEGPGAGRLAARAHLDVRYGVRGRWKIISPVVDDPDQDTTGPRVALRRTRRFGDRYLVLIEAERLGAPSIPVGFDIADRVGARAVVLRSRFDTIAAPDERFASQLAEHLGLDRVLRIASSAASSQVELVCPDALPEELSLEALGSWLGHPVHVSFRPPLAGSELAAALRLELPEQVAGEIAARRLGVEAAEDWTLSTLGEWSERLRRLTYSDPQRFALPTSGELRLYGELLRERFEASSPPTAPQLALAAQLGLHFARARGAFDAWVLFEPEGSRRRGLPTLVQRRDGHAGGLSLGLGAPRWQRGGIDSALRLTAALQADLLIVHGTAVNLVADRLSDPRRPEGRKAWFQRAHEVWLDAGGRSVLLRGVDEERPTDAEAVLSLDAELPTVASAPEWARRLADRLEVAGIATAAVDGSAQYRALAARADPVLGYARRFAPGRSLALWLRPELRLAWSGAASPRSVLLALPSEAGALPDLQAVLADPPTRSAGVGGRHGSRGSGCDTARIEADWLLHRRSNNPHFLDAALRLGLACGWRAAFDPTTETAWLAGPTQRSSGARTVRLLPLLRPPLGLASAREPARERTMPLSTFQQLRGLARGPVEVVLP